MATETNRMKAGTQLSLSCVLVFGGDCGCGVLLLECLGDEYWFQHCCQLFMWWERRVVGAEAGVEGG